MFQPFLVGRHYPACAVNNFRVARLWVIPEHNHVLEPHLIDGLPQHLDILMPVLMGVLGLSQDFHEVDRVFYRGLHPEFINPGLDNIFSHF